MLTLGTIQMDDREKTVAVDGDPVALTPTEYDILKLLLEHPGQVVLPQGDLPEGMEGRSLRQ